MGRDRAYKEILTACPSGSCPAGALHLTSDRQTAGAGPPQALRSGIGAVSERQ